LLVTLALVFVGGTAAGGGKPFSLLVMNQCELGPVTRKLDDARPVGGLDSDFRFRKNFVGNGEPQQMNCSGRLIPDDTVRSLNAKDKAVAAEHQAMVEKEWAQDLKNTNFVFHAKKEIFRPNEGDSGFRATMNFSGKLQLGPKFANAAKNNPFLTTNHECRLKIVDI
jgi:hypothetical protein